MTKKRTVVVSAYPCCGKTYAFEHYQNKYSILDLDSDIGKFGWMFRKRTKEELDAVKEAWECAFGSKVTHWMPLPEPPEGSKYGR